MNRATGDLIEVLHEAKTLVARPGNDFSSSSWRDAQDALEEIDGLIQTVRSGGVPSKGIAVLFAPTGPMQELGESSGLGQEFLALADRADAALAAWTPALKATYRCAVCGAHAGAIEVARAEIRRESFTGVLTQPVVAGGFQRLEAALATGDAARLFELDPEYAPFYCPPCNASYCGEHWDRWDVFDEDMPDWRDSIRGRCPHGHERMLED